MPTLKIPQAFQYYTSGQSLLLLDGSTVGELLTNLAKQYPELWQHLANRKGKLHFFVHLFLCGEEIPRDSIMQTKLNAEDVVILVPGIAGG